MLGGDKPVAIQSITRAITALVNKGLIEKGKVRSRKRFVLIHRPLKETINSILKATKHFVGRYAPSKIMGAVSKISTNQFGANSTKQIGIHKESKVKPKKSKIYDKRGKELWSRVCPSGREDKFDISSISTREATQLINWIYEAEQEWIKDTWPEEVSKLKNEVIYG